MAGSGMGRAAAATGRDEADTGLAQVERAGFSAARPN
jgi:hypothetical protein